jgi:peptidoglycan/xylan/chitin deacetylase (PgdA/CDA1 family)
MLDRLRPPPRVEASRPGAGFGRDEVEARVTLVTVPDIHAASTLERVRDFGPDLGLSIAAPILKPDLFSIPRLGTINLHKGKLPEHRGMPPAFWEMYRGEREVGCTVHAVDAGLDTGPVVCRTTIPIHAHSTVKGLRLTLDEVGIALMRDAALDVLDGRATPEPQPSGGTTYRKPTLAQQREMARRAPRHGTGMREIAKSAAFWAHVHLVRPLPRRILASSASQRVVVLLYHRVRDDRRDPLTVGLEQFDAQMAWLARHCPLVDIRDVVAGRIPRDTRRPAVAVTLDDGSLDHHEHAFPILLRHRIPAGFFVPTGAIGGQGSMSWDHLREMRAAGFTVGSHSVTHLDCARAEPSRVRAELRESRDALAEQLGVREPIFAYPVGYRENMTPEALELVRGEGYVGCLSAYGGYNVGRIDPFDVRRVGISHAFSELAFRARVEGW